MSTAAGLRIEDVTVRFGGVVAVNGVSLVAPGGSITGLIGPNGAGKTTTFNAATGHVTPSSGSVSLGEVRLNGLRPSKRARLGLGRSFQRMELWDGMTVRENVALGPEAHYAGRAPWAMVIGRRSERADIEARTDDALRRCGITHLAGRAAGNLSTGQRRLVELARAMATPFKFLLLDEPSSGLDVEETEAFGAALARFVADSGIGVLLVEHDIALVGAACSYCYVLDFGRLIHDGPTREVLGSDIVRKAYLGSADLEEELTTDA